MTDVKLNGMRELSFKEIEDVSGGAGIFSFFRLMFRSPDVGRGSDRPGQFMYTPPNSSYNVYNNLNFV